MKNQRDYEQTQTPKRHKPRLKLGRRREAGTTAAKKSKRTVGLNEHLLKLEAEVRTLRRRLNKKGGRS